jgi:hypothetical protein
MSALVSPGSVRGFVDIFAPTMDLPEKQSKGAVVVDR